MTRGVWWSSDTCPVRRDPIFSFLDSRWFHDCFDPRSRAKVMIREGRGYILMLPPASAWFAESSWPWNCEQECQKFNYSDYSLLEWPLLGARHVSEQVISAVCTCFSSSVAPAIQSIAHMASDVVEQRNAIPTVVFPNSWPTECGT